MPSEKSFEIFPRYNGVATILGSFNWNLIISAPLTNKYLFAALKCKLKQNPLALTVKLIEYLFLQLMLYCLIVVWNFHQEIKYLFSYYQNVQKNPYQHKKMLHLEKI